MIIIPSMPFSSESSQRFSNCTCTMDVGVMKILSDCVCGNVPFTFAAVVQ